jgi:anti-sigma-K factor RskA
MTTIDATCAAVRADAAEFVLGTLDGIERSRVADHIGGCVRCREEIASLADTVRDLALLAPPMEPSAGFVERVVVAGGGVTLAPVPAPARPAPVPLVGTPRAGAPRRHHRRRWVGLTVMAAALLLVVVGLVTIRRPATTPGTASFAAMVAPDGELIGTSWSEQAGTIGVSVRYPENWHDYRLEAVHDDGSVATLGSMTWQDGAWMWRGAVPGSDSVNQLRVVRPDGQLTCAGPLPPV